MVIDQFRDIVSPAIPCLLGIILTEADPTLGEDVKKILFHNFPAVGGKCEHLKEEPFVLLMTGVAELVHDVFIAIPPMMPKITNAGKAIVFQLIDTRKYL
jgi:hypothetical protein